MIVRRRARIRERNERGRMHKRIMHEGKRRDEGIREKEETREEKRWRG